MDKFTVIMIAFPHNWKIVSTSLKTRTISLILLVILSGCSGITYPQSVPHITPTQEPLFPRISDKNVSELDLIREWTPHSVLTMAWSIDSNLFAIIGRENDDNHFGVYGYSITALERLWFHETSAPLPGSLAFRPDNQAIAIPFWGYYLIDRASGEVISEIDIKDQCYARSHIQYSPDGTKVFTVQSLEDHSIVYHWDAVEHQCLGKLIEEDGMIHNFQISSDGQFIVLGLSRVGMWGEQQVHLWDVEGGQQLCNINGYAIPTLIPGGNVVAVANIADEGIVEFWDLKRCEFLDRLDRKKTKPYSLTFSPDGRLLAVGEEDSIEIWDVATRKIIFEVGKLSNYVDILSFSPDGRFLLSIIPETSLRDKAKIQLWGITP